MTFSPLIFKIQSKKTTKRHQLSMTFPCVFRFLTEKDRLNFEDEGATFLVFFVRNLKTQGKDIKSWCLFGQIPKTTRKSHWKLMSFQRLFGLNFEDEGAKTLVFLLSSEQKVNYWDFLTHFLTYFLTTVFDGVQNSSYYNLEFSFIT